MSTPDSPPDGDEAAATSIEHEQERQAPMLGEQDPRLWKGDGWTARVLKNEDDEGWAVSMTADGQSDPSLVGPWTMGRDKKNPKPLDSSAFATLVKTANEILARHAQQRWAQLHRSVTTVDAEGVRRKVALEVIPDEDDAHAILSVHGEDGEIVKRSRVPASFKLTSESARKWLVDGASE